jgi:arylsulfatase A-like enzyme
MKILFVWLCALFGGASAALPAQNPNVVLIVADDPGRADYSATGTRDLRTPHLDRLCAWGMTFTNFHVHVGLAGAHRW